MNSSMHVHTLMLKTVCVYNTCIVLLYPVHAAEAIQFSNVLVTSY